MGFRGAFARRCVGAAGLFLVLLAIAGCKSRYNIETEIREERALGYVAAPLTDPNGRGYRHEKISDTSYKVTVRGSGVDNYTRLKDVALRHAAEIAAKNGAETFRLSKVTQGMRCEAGFKQSDPEISMILTLNPQTPEKSMVYQTAQILKAVRASAFLPPTNQDERYETVIANRRRCGLITPRH